MGLILLCSFFEIDQHNCEALNAISCSENHMTDSSDLPSLLKILFRTYSNRQNRSILGSVSKGNYTSATDIFADHIAVLIVADGLFCREIDGLFCRSSPDIIVRRRCVLSHKRRGWLQPSPSFRYSRNLALQDELYHPVINNGPAVLVCVDKRLGTGPVNQSRDAG